MALRIFDSFSLLQMQTIMNGFRAFGPGKSLILFIYQALRMIVNCGVAVRISR